MGLFHQTQMKQMPENQSQQIPLQGNVFWQIEREKRNDGFTNKTDLRGQSIFTH